METDRESTILSYHCLKYLLINIGNSLKSNEYELLEENEQDGILNYVGQLNDDFDNMQKSLRMKNEDEASTVIERFANNQYNEALRDHEAGNANLLTASKYYNSKVFYDILEQLQPLNDDEQKRRTFAAERSISITNDINSGKVPSAIPHELVKFIIILTIILSYYLSKVQR